MNLSLDHVAVTKTDQTRPPRAFKKSVGFGRVRSVLVAFGYPLAKKAGKSRSFFSPVARSRNLNQPPPSMHFPTLCRNRNLNHNPSHPEESLAADPNQNLAIVNAAPPYSQPRSTQSRIQFLF